MKIGSEVVTGQLSKERVVYNNISLERCQASSAKPNVTSCVPKVAS